MSPLFEAVCEGRLDEIRRLVGENPSLLNRGELKNGPIHSAANANQAEALAPLLDLGADINVRDEDGMTALHRAAENPQAARVLLERGADPEIYDLRGCTPLVIALSGQTDDGEEVANLLYQAGARRGLFDACILADLDRVQLVFEKDPDALAAIPSHERLLGETMYVGNYGVIEDRVEIVELLCAHGLKLDAEYVRREIKNLRLTNVPWFIPALERYLAEGTT